MYDVCKLCGESASSGEHGLSPEAAEKYPQAFCPRCSGLGVVLCVTATKYQLYCTCSVRWSEPITPS
jgi:hypothetical protein